MTFVRRSGALLLLLVCFFAPRLAVVQRAVTADEARWLLRSGNFYQALASGNLAATYQHEHPGVTITWAGALGYLWRFPGYARLVDGQLPGPSALENLFADQGRSPLLVLAASRILVVLGLGLILALAGWYASGLVGWWAAGLGIGLIALDPFSLSLSYLLQPDGMSASLMLLSVLAFADYCLAGRRRLDLLVSGGAGGLAVLSKSPAVFLLPFLGLVGIIWLADLDQPLMSTARWKRSIQVVLAWSGTAGLTFFLLWPAMWVDPLGTLQNVFGGAIQYAAAGNQNAVFFNGQIYASGSSAWNFYLVALIWRMAPVMLAGLLLAAWRWIAGYGKAGADRTANMSARTLLLFAGLYVLAISLSSQKYDRYLLPAWLALIMLAGWGWAGLLEWLVGRIERRGDRYRQVAAGVVLSLILLACQGAGAAQAYPYYYSYYNPLLGGLNRAAQVLMVGWGEGLDQAGLDLDALPNAARLRVMSWYADGCFSYFFRGRTVGMDTNTTLADVKQMDYVVVYYQQLQRQEPSKEILDYLADLSPVKVIRVGELDMVQIYKIK